MRRATCLLAAVSLTLFLYISTPLASYAMEPAPAGIDAAALDKSRSEVASVFRDELRAAKSPAAKATLSRKLTETARSTNDDPAGRWALIELAREAADQSRDDTAVFQVIAAKVELFPPADDTKVVVKAGHELWAQAGAETGLAAKRLRWDAAAKYLAVRGKVTGIERVAVEKRLKEMGGEDRQPAKQPTYLDDLNAVGVKTGHGEMEKKPQTIRGVTYPHSIHLHPPANGSAYVSYSLGGQFSTLQGNVGILDGSGLPTPLAFRAIGDGKILWESKPQRAREPPQDFSVSVKRTITLTLEIACPGPNPQAWAIWLDPRLSK